MKVKMIGAGCIGLLLGCQVGVSRPSPSELKPSGSPAFGGNTQACTPLGEELEANLQVANPDNKAALTAAELGVGKDAYLQMRFAKADSNQDQQLNASELRAYLADLPRLGSICLQP